MNIRFDARRWWWWVAALLVAWSWPGRAATPELQLEARLVWATNGDKPKDQKLKDLDAATKDKLRRVFKWRDYYEVDRQEIKVATASKKRVRMSPKCEVEVENLGRATVEVKLFGEGKLVVKKKQTLESEELLVLAGDDKDDTAWFVVMNLVKR